MSARKVGTVVWFRDAKGYGFIRPDDADEDLFFHWSYLQMNGFKSIKADSRVSFEVGANHKGPMAMNIQLIYEDELYDDFD